MLCLVDCGENVNEQKYFTLKGDWRNRGRIAGVLPAEFSGRSISKAANQCRISGRITFERA